MIPVKTALGQQVLKDRSVALTPRQRAALIVIDGKRTIAELHQAVSSTVGELKSWDAFRPAFDRVYATFNKLNRLFLTR